MCELEAEETEGAELGLMPVALADSGMIGDRGFSVEDAASACSGLITCGSRRREVDSMMDVVYMVWYIYYVCTKTFREKEKKDIVYFC